MSSIICQIKPEHPELFAHEFGKIAESDFVYTPSLAHLSTECSVSYCDHSLPVGVRPSVHPSVHNFLTNTIASTNINQSAPNLV